MKNNRTFQDAFNLLCGKPLGRGIHRQVYECTLRPELVVKVEIHEYKHRSFMNPREMDFWTYWSEHKPVAKWLAPCQLLSPDGRILLQTRCDPLPRAYPLPEKLPAFLTDHKQDNFGLLNGELVCLDYALVRYAAHTNLKKAMFHT